MHIVVLENPIPQGFSFGRLNSDLLLSRNINTYLSIPAETDKPLPGQNSNQSSAI